MPNCSVPMCSEQGGHCFPKDQEVYEKWRVAIRRVDKDSGKLWVPGSAARVCSKHFLPSDYNVTLTGKFKSLKRDAVPSIFPFNEKIKIDEGREKRALERSKRMRSSVVESTPSVSAPYFNPSNDEKVHLEEVIDFDDSGATQHSTRESSNIISVGIQCGQSAPGTSFLQSHKANDKAVKYYTSFSNYNHFEFFFAALGPAALHLKYQSQLLSPIEQLFLTLIKLRQCKDDFELALLFRVSETSVRKIFSVWLNFLYYQLKEINIWPSSDLVKEHMPYDFKQTFPNTRVILDATEIPIQKPSDLVAQSSTFSSYKNRNTVKAVVGCTPSGLISFVSDVYGGRATDRQIIERSSLVNNPDMFSAKDSIMADRGIMVQDLFAAKDVQVNTPHFLQGKNQFAPEEIVFDRHIASKRIHIERLIGLGKTFKILKHELNQSKVGISHKIIFVCFAISNFRNTVVDKFA